MIIQNNTTTKHMEVTMSKQTAVDFFHDEVNKLLPKKIITTNDIGLIWVKAKEMEKEQIKFAYNDGAQDMFEGKYKAMQDYYNETYGGEND